MVLGQGLWCFRDGEWLAAEVLRKMNGRLPGLDHLLRRSQHFSTLGSLQRCQFGALASRGRGHPDLWQDVPPVFLVGPPFGGGHAPGVDGLRVGAQDLVFVFLVQVRMPIRAELPLFNPDQLRHLLHVTVMLDSLPGDWKRRVLGPRQVALRSQIAEHALWLLLLSQILLLDLEHVSALRQLGQSLEHCQWLVLLALLRLPRLRVDIGFAVAVVGYNLQLFALQ